MQPIQNCNLERKLISNSYVRNSLKVRTCIYALVNHAMLCIAITILLFFMQQVVDIPGKGRGVTTTRPFSKNEFMCDYGGKLISKAEVHAREEALPNHFCNRFC